MLLFSNANSSSRAPTAPSATPATTAPPGAPASSSSPATWRYSTVTALSDGTFGLLYEGDSDNIVFAKFNAEWLNPFCGAQVTAAALSGANGATVQAQISVKNVGDTALEGATATFTTQAGWVFGSAAVPRRCPGPELPLSALL